MTHAELQELARKLDEKSVTAGLRALAEDPRFAAFLALLEQHKNSCVRWVADPKMAAHHGPLAHCAGSLRAVLLLEDAIAALFQKKPQTGLKPPQDPEE